MSTLLYGLAILAGWLGIGLLLAPLIGGLLKMCVEQDYPHQKKPRNAP